MRQSIFWDGVALGLFLAACYVMAVVYIFHPKPAAAHEWYDPVCCNEKDCRPVAADAVTPTADGYAVQVGGQTVLVPYGKEHPQRSPDGLYHICTYSISGPEQLRTRGPITGVTTDRRVCLHVPPSGM